MIELTSQPIDVTPLLAKAQQPAAGAIVLFLGITREFTAGRQTAKLSYEAYEPMARSELEKLEKEARQRWELTECLIVHRLGETPLAEASVAIVTASAHRAAAFEAGRWLIDNLKTSVPIWKQETWADGSTDWVHPQSTN